METAIVCFHSIYLLEQLAVDFQIYVSPVILSTIIR